MSFIFSLFLGAQSKKEEEEDGRCHHREIIIIVSNWNRLRLNLCV
jgi:hypothetical protein